MKSKFNPLIFLAPLGAGGIAIIPFAFLNYTINHGAGLINVSQLAPTSVFEQATYLGLEGTMLLFTALHVILTLTLLPSLIRWFRTPQARELIHDPLHNAGFLAPFISLTMSLNVLIGPFRFFIPTFYENLQTMMFPGFIAWAIIWIAIMITEIRLLQINFLKSFDISKVSFGWLLHPFTLGMATVTGTGIAAMAQDASIAHTAAFMSLISGTMGIFLFVVKLISLFKSHFGRDGLMQENFLPSYLIVLPGVTLFAISAFRFGHYLDHHQGAELSTYFTVVMATAFAFEVWYLLFGLTLLSDYFRRDFHRKFSITQWGLICPLVAFAVLGSFVFKVFFPSPIIWWTIIITLIVVILLFLFLLKRQFLSGRE